MENETVLLSRHQMPPALFILTAEGQRAALLQGTQTLGRQTKSHTPDLAVSSRAVSREHGVFRTGGNQIEFEDLGSSNGTSLNGKPLQPWQRVALNDGDVLRIHGREDESYEMDVLLVCSQNYPLDFTWETLELTSDMAEIAIGRQEGLALHADTVSRRHASFFQTGGGWALIDHSSRNGVLLNGRRLQEPAYLIPMDLVSISGYLFLFKGGRLLYQADRRAEPAAAFRQAPISKPEPQAVPEPASQPAAQPEPAQPSRTAPVHQDGQGLSIWIESRDVWQRAKKKTLLRDIDLQIDNGSMVLVLGGSGAGKTTFMNAVMGYEPAQGEIVYNGMDIYEEYEKMKYQIGYVPQQDLLRMNDTVRDTLMNAARMRLPSRLKREQLNQRVQETSEMLGLSREMDSLVGKLSGGQRKRLSIAVEYIGNPALFFLDEPDSGLDGTMARALMENLRSIADSGKIVIVISHAPDRAFELFDRVLVLAKDSRENCGRLAFWGTPEEACSFFETDSLEHVVRRINRPDEGGDGLADHYIDQFEKRGTCNE